MEGFIEVPGGRVWYRSVGEGGIPLLGLHGGPGFTHYYLEPLEALSGRLSPWPAWSGPSPRRADRAGEVSRVPAVGRADT
jgi:hypothetical protein